MTFTQQAQPQLNKANIGGTLAPFSINGFCSRVTHWNKPRHMRFTYRIVSYHTTGIMNTNTILYSYEFQNCNNDSAAKY